MAERIEPSLPPKILLDIVGDRDRLVTIGMAAVAAACTVFAFSRLATALSTGRPTPWGANVAGIIVVLAAYVWYRRSPSTRSGAAVHVTAAVATTTLLIPMIYGMSSTVWWLSLVAFAVVLLGRRSEALVWGIVIPVIVLAASLAEEFVRFGGTPGENLAEKLLSKTVFVVLVVAMATGFRAVANQRAAALQESEERFKMLVENTDDFVFLTDAEGRRLYASPSYFKASGWTMEEIQDSDWRTGVHPEDLGAVESAHEANLAGRSTTVEYRSRRKDGSWMWLEAKCQPVLGPDGQRQTMVLVSRDITERKEDQVRRDLLTGLPNRFLFYEEVAGAIDQAQLEDGRLAILLINMDRFEEVNESRDHSVGDLVLQAVARRLGSGLAPRDLLARMGGDEFAVLLRDARSSGDAGAVATRLLDEVAASLLLASQEFHLTASIGISLFPSDGNSPGTLMRSADFAMRGARRVGGNTYQFVTSDMAASASERLFLKEGLRRAIESQELVLHYQPLLALTSGEIKAMEALVRWRHPHLGLLLPDRFIGLVEESALIHSLGEWVLRAACRQCRAWNAETGEPLCIAVNLSARQFLQADLADGVRRTVEAAGIDPSLLILEITESTAMWDMDQTVVALKALRDLGVRIAIDDFGKGYSSLAYLKRFPIDFIKIDRSFIQDVALVPDDAAIVSSVISLAHGLKLTVVAEGVESLEQLEFLRNAGCDLAQGYYVRHPAPPEELHGLLHRTGGVH